MRDSLRPSTGSHTVHWRFALRRTSRREAEPVNHDNMIGLAVATAGGLTLAAAALLPAALILPAIALVALLGAAAAGAYAFWTAAPHSTTPRLSAWDVAGVLALIGFGAGMISDPVHVLHLFGAAPPNL